MIERLSPWNLGATLYMPATRTDIATTIIDQKIDGLRSLIICLEDAVSDTDIPQALQNLATLLTTLSDYKKHHDCTEWPLLFIRPRHTEMAQWLVEHVDLTVIDGLVLPKFTQASL
ncbi:HpcH/HpaI aldolase/citrate lyase family protein, partial [Escherichia coli]|uniref:HpcH/HpaI aldolase/citrate lyase family protein n=2 Tax=Enterobacterales TaxID=91347 RepID=UPI00293BBFD8